MSRKTTEAIWLGLQSISPDLRPCKNWSAAMANRSAGRRDKRHPNYHQRAALKLDIAPEEFETLEPRLRGGSPLLQIADFLVNGAGFSHRLAELESDDIPLIIHLIRSVLDDPSDPLVHSYFNADHRHECGQASVTVALDGIAIGSYHGLLDWRLGLGFLRAMLTPCRFGLDADWAACREFEDWPRLALQVADEIVRINPADRQITSVRRDRLTSFASKASTIFLYTLFGA